MEVLQYMLLTCTSVHLSSPVTSGSLRPRPWGWTMERYMELQDCRSMCAACSPSAVCCAGAPYVVGACPCMAQPSFRSIFFHHFLPIPSISPSLSILFPCSFLPFSLKFCWACPTCEVGTSQAFLRWVPVGGFRVSKYLMKALKAVSAWLGQSQGVAVLRVSR